MYKGRRLPEHLAAFNPDKIEDILTYEQIVFDAGEMFHKICGYQPEHFIASNSPEPKLLETTLKKIGIKYLTRFKFQKYPLGDGKYLTEFNWLGKKNKLGQLYLTRNAAFEPSDPSIKDWVASCLKEINIAFLWKKPVIISSHRVNYIGYLDPDNAFKGLNQLHILLTQITKYWPEVEFMTSAELGHYIGNNLNDEEASSN